MAQTDKEQMDAHERSGLMLDAMPLFCAIWDKNLNLIDCNKKAVEMFKLRDKQEFKERFFEMSPKFQNDGQLSQEVAVKAIQKTFENGCNVFKWTHMLQNGTLIPAEVTLTRVNYGEETFVVGNIRDLREYRHMLGEIERRDQLMQTVNSAATILLDSEISQFESCLYHGMGMIADAVDADRVYIWKNHTHHGQLYATQLHEWSERAEPQQDKEYTINVSYRETLPEWEKILSKGECINSLVCDMPPETNAWLSIQDILSIFIAPVFLKNQFWGFVGFDKCRKKEKFSENVESILRSSCLMIANAFLRHNNISEIVRLQANLEETLNKAQMASHAKSVFLAQMSHEIRTPMNSIIGFSELALDGETSPKTREYLEKIHKNADWLLLIINDILDISKIESGKMELEKIPFDLHELLASCKNLIMPKADEKGIELYFYSEPSLDKEPLGDPTRLRQALLNLLSNAVKFTNTGIVKVYAEITEKSEKTVAIKFIIKDTGIGMTVEQINKIFDPFTQAETGTTRKYGGSGLGLTITKNIVELMGGKLSVESAPGIGSTFSFDLTFDTIESGNIDIRRKITLDELEKPTFNGEILLCEDNIMNQQVICEHLARVGLKAVVADNGRIGVDIVKSRVEKGEKQFDLVFMDIYMPIMDGIEASKKIMEINKDIPVVAMTANVMSGDRELYSQSGIKDCIGKPFTSQELWHCLMKYFTPAGGGTANKKTQTEDNLEFQKSLLSMFVRNNQNTFKEIVRAMDEDEINLAHRLTHTLKSNAGHIGKKLLQKAASDVEQKLKMGENNVTKEQLNILETELNNVLNEYSPLPEKNIVRAGAGNITSEPEKMRELFQKLEVLLKNGNPECLDLINDLHIMPKTGSLEFYQIQQMIQQMEDFNFNSALCTFMELKKNLK